MNSSDELILNVLQNSADVLRLLSSDVVLGESSLQGSLVVLLIVMCLGGKRVICATVQKPSVQTNDEHLHDHHLLT